MRLLKWLPLLSLISLIAGAFIYPSAYFFWGAKIGLLNVKVYNHPLLPREGVSSLRFQCSNFHPEVLELVRGYFDYSVESFIYLAKAQARIDGGLSRLTGRSIDQDDGLAGLQDRLEMIRPFFEESPMAGSPFGCYLEVPEASLNAFKALGSRGELPAYLLNSPPDFLFVSHTPIRPEELIESLNNEENSLGDLLSGLEEDVATQLVEVINSLQAEMNWVGGVPFTQLKSPHMPEFSVYLTELGSGHYIITSQPKMALDFILSFVHRPFQKSDPASYKVFALEVPLPPKDSAELSLALMMVPEGLETLRMSLDVLPSQIELSVGVAGPGAGDLAPLAEMGLGLVGQHSQMKVDVDVSDNFIGAKGALHISELLNRYTEHMGARIESRRSLAVQVRAIVSDYEKGSLRVVMANQRDYQNPQPFTFLTSQGQGVVEPRPGSSRGPQLLFSGGCPGTDSSLRLDNRETGQPLLISLGKDQGRTTHWKREKGDKGLVILDLHIPSGTRLSDLRLAWESSPAPFSLLGQSQSQPQGCESTSPPVLVY